MQLRLCFKVNQRVNTYLYQIVADLVERGQIAPQNHRYSIYREHSAVGDFRFCLLRKLLSPETDISGADYRCMELKYLIRRLCGSPAKWYGLESSSVIFEYVPLFSKTKRQHRLSRVELPQAVATSAGGPGATGEGSLRSAEGTPAQDADEDEDIFSAAMRADRERLAEDAEKDLVGGDTAVFKPLVISDEGEAGQEGEK